MEADWSVELAAEDPVIVVPWAGAEGGCGFVDLRPGMAETPPGDALAEIEEARRDPVLRAALLELNGSQSPLWTAKCDAWLTDSSQAEGETVDLLEMDCASSSGEDARFVAGLYIDILPRNPETARSFAIQERILRSLAGRLRSTGPHCARIEFILRRAETWGSPGFAVTWFVEACGATADRAAQRRTVALEYALPIVIEEPWR